MYLPPPRVHVLGLGSIGTFAAHCLADIPNRPAITLLLHRQSLAESFVRNENAITLQTRKGEIVKHGGFDSEVCQNGQWFQHSMTNPLRPALEPIEHLVVCTKTIKTVEALRSLKSRLGPKSNILFLQNGCGVIDAVNKDLFPDPLTRPNYIVGVISHGVGLNSPFNITHTGFAATSIGAAPRGDHSPNGSESYLLKALPKSFNLNATAYPYLSAFQIQLEKLAVNAFCNPYCALADSPNAYLFTIPDQRRAILTEISTVVQALPELQTVEGIQERFCIQRLEKTVGEIIEKTRETTCSMVWDLRGGRRTEVGFINGYWMKRGREVGVATQINDELVRRIEEREKEMGAN